MKCFLLLVLCFSLSFVSMAQNLVPNPSFEDTLACPTTLDQMYDAEGWSSFGNSPDYFNACAPIGLNVPNSEFGFEYAHSGVAMAGLGTYRDPSSPDGPNYREYIGIQLLNSLQAEEKYYLSFFVNFAFGPSVAIATNKIGCRFSTIAYSEFNESPVNNHAALYTDSILVDSVQWYKLSGSFTADSVYSFLVIGNFFKDNLTDTLVVGQFPDYSYYYIDDVCVTTDSLYNETWSGILDQNNHLNILEIYPNPNSGVLNIKSDDRLETIQISNDIGELVYEAQKIHEFYFRAPLEHLPAGLYFLRAKTENSLIIKLIDIIH